MMGFHNILLPLDGSNLGQRAVDAAIKAAATHAVVTILSVVTEKPEIVFERPELSLSGISPDYGSLPVEVSPTPQLVMGALMNAREQYAHEMRLILEDVGLAVKTTIETGDVVKAITAAITAETDLIVMATHGRTGINRLLLGSVAESILRHTACPVLFIPVHLA